MTITDSDYPDVPCNVPAPIVGCCWLHEGPACSCHTGNHLFCIECGHEAECHETVRIDL
jgi:hypothetical protein